MLYRSTGFTAIALQAARWLAASTLALAPAAMAQQAENLLEKHGCLGCHAVGETKMGPSFRDVAAKYRGDKEAGARLVAALREGKGHPIKSEAPEADLRTLVRFVLSARAAPAAPKAATAPAPAPQSLDRETCLGCHGNEGFSMPDAQGKPRDLSIDKSRFEHSVHGKRECVECHADITGIPHKPMDHQVSCVNCHDDLWKKAQKEGTTAQNPRLGVVVQQIDSYMKSVHARPNRDDQTRTNAGCHDCHDAHYVYPLGTTERDEWRFRIPDVCGRCHERQRQEYAVSVHGREVLQNKNPAAAVCSDCHTTHEIDRPAEDRTKLAITKNCGGCHTESYKTYRATYHGQIHTLGYAYTATCFDCHGSHNIQRTADQTSTVHPNNRFGTCRSCHKNATRGFLTFQPHASTHDFERYPVMYVTAKFMVALIIGVFLFFWTHSALWFYREYRDRKEGKVQHHVALEGLPGHLRGKHFRRFGPWWRAAHLAFAVSLMTLAVTGMTAFYAEAAWASALVEALGGPQVTARIHRVAGVIILAIFAAQLLYFLVRLVPRWRTFRWFSHISLVPSIQDVRDMLAMFRWFFGMAPRPVFGRWTYWERFDYWAPFWGLTIVGTSGLMLWFKDFTASIFPGWVFNIGTLAHGEEAFLAIVFLFTVHFFNNHFRPDKLPPPDIVMFTGTMPLEEFAREHTIEYRELLEKGELERHLVDAPSAPMTQGSRLLGLVLLGIGLTILTLVLVGFVGSFR